MSTHTPLTTAITLLPRIPATNSLAMTSNSAHLHHPFLGCCQTSPHHLLMHRALGIIFWWDATALYRNSRSLLSPYCIQLFIYVGLLTNVNHSNNCHVDSHAPNNCHNSLASIPATNLLAMTSNSAHLHHPFLRCCQTSPHCLLMHRALCIIF